MYSILNWILIHLHSLFTNYVQEANKSTNDVRIYDSYLYCRGEIWVVIVSSPNLHGAENDAALHESKFAYTCTKW